MQVKSALQGEHSAIFSTFIKLPFVIKIFVLSIFEWPLTVLCIMRASRLVRSYIVICKVVGVSKQCSNTKSLLEI